MGREPLQGAPLGGIIPVPAYGFVLHGLLSLLFLIYKKKQADIDPEAFRWYLSFCYL